MAFFDKLGETIVNVGKDATQKAKDLSGVAKLNLDIKAKEDYVQRQYTELGRIYYEEHKTESEVDGAEHFDFALCSGNGRRRDRRTHGNVQKCRPAAQD